MNHSTNLMHDNLLSYQFRDKTTSLSDRIADRILWPHFPISIKKMFYIFIMQLILHIFINFFSSHRMYIDSCIRLQAKCTKRIQIEKISYKVKIKMVLTIIIITYFFCTVPLGLHKVVIATRIFYCLLQLK